MHLYETRHSLRNWRVSRQGMTRDDLLRVKFARLQAFLMFVDTHSPYYGEIFRKSQFSPTTFTDIEQLRVLPIRVKRRNSAQPDDPLSASFAVNSEAETSGSSGQALEFRKNEVGLGSESPTSIAHTGGFDCTYACIGISLGLQHFSQPSS